MENRQIPYIGQQSPSLVETIYKAAKNENIKALVIRMNSPGGSVGMTQEIYQAIRYLRSKGILTVASFTDIAASGAYYIGAACDYIFANPGTLTGSIGVIIQSPSMAGLFEKLGIRMQTIKAGKFKDILNIARNANQEELRFLQTMVDQTYMQFVRDVASGRKMKLEKVLEAAEGKIYNGEQAHKIGLVDSIGGFHDALLFAHKKAKLPGDVPEIIPLHESPLQKFFQTIENHQEIPLLQILGKAFAFLHQTGDRSNVLPGNLERMQTTIKGAKYENLIQYRFVP